MISVTSLVCSASGCIVEVSSNGTIPGWLAMRRCSFVLSASNPPMKPGSSAFSSPGKKPRRTIPLGMYMITSFLLGLAAIEVLSSPTASECKNGNASIAPLAFKNFLRDRFMDFLLTVEQPETDLSQLTASRKWFSAFAVHGADSDGSMGTSQNVSAARPFSP